MLNGNGESRHPCLLPNFRKGFSLLTLSLILAVDFVLFVFAALVRLRRFPSVPGLLGVLSWRSVRFCPVFFLHILRWPCGICPLFCDMPYYINWYFDVNVKPIVHSWDKSHFVMMYNLFYTLLDLVLLGKFYWGLCS